MKSRWTTVIMFEKELHIVIMAIKNIFLTQHHQRGDF